MLGSSAWYDQLRDQHRPQHVRVLFIAESPPDPGAGDKRFFYSPELSSHDNLFRGIAEALYGDLVVYQRSKANILQQLQEDGFWLIDAVSYPINRRTPSMRREAIKSSATKLVDRCKQLAPELGVIICHKGVYEEVAHKLLGGGVKILHRRPLPFPLYAGKEDFKAGVREALGMTPNR